MSAVTSAATNASSATQTIASFDSFLNSLVATLKISLGVEFPIIAGDTVWAQLPTDLALAVVVARNGEQLSLRREEKSSTIFTLSIKEVTPLRRADRLPLEVGASVEILQHKNLNCSRFGSIRYIDGGYIYVLPDSEEAASDGSLNRCYELYECEIKVVAVYRHQQFFPGTLVKITGVNWGRRKPRPLGTVLGVESKGLIVQAVGAKKGATIFVAFEKAELAVTPTSEN